MIYTFYTNYYGGLQEALFQDIEQDINRLRGNLENVFKKISVISPSLAVDNRLSHELANRFAANPGVEFISLFEWLQPFIGTILRPESQGSALVWQIWWALNSPEFKNVLKNASSQDRESAHRLISYIEATTDGCQLLDLCIRLSTLYTTYASYRSDWLLHWIDGNKFPLTENTEKAEFLRSHPDYYWQKELWHFIASHDQTEDIRRLTDLPEKLNDIQLPKEMLGKDFYLFMPFALPPLALPFIRAFSKDSDTNLKLYILNPSSEYWFDSVAKNLFDWSVQGDNTALQYLRKNASSTRAMIDRLYRFLDPDNDKVQEAELEDLDRPRLIQGIPNERRFSPVNVALQELQLSTNSDDQSYYFEKPADSYLHKFQNSILKLDSSLLPDQPDGKDESLKVFKAPTFIRELEGIVDWLHYRFHKDPNLKASDVLVVVPDIEKSAPEIEGVMGGLADHLRLPWKIVDNSVIDTELTVNAVIGLGKLINSTFEKADFLEWLELPINQQKWHLSLSDVTDIGKWLTSAGFHKGLSNKHLSSHGYYDEDFSLDCAIERLVLGYFINSTERQPCENVLPIFGTESGGFTSVSDDKGRLLKNLLSISEALKSCWADLDALKDGAPPQTWYKTINGWLGVFFDLPKAPQNLISFKSTLVRVVEAMKAGLPEDTQIPFDVLWKLIETRLHSSKAHIKQTGAITFAPISATRGLSYKIIAAAGFDEASGFPGRNSFDEFDLMGVDKLKRKGDRDSRDDRRALFLDILLSAQNNVVISYSVGTNDAQESNPSSVIESFKHYFLSHASSLDNTGAIAKELWKTVEVSIPLNSFSRDNFQEVGAKNWLSPRKELLNSVTQAISSQYSKEENIFVDESISSKSLERLPALTLISFLNDPINYVTKKLGLPYEGEDLAEPVFTWLPDDSAYSNAIRFRSIQSDLENSFNETDIINRRKLDPAYGLKEVRETFIGQEVKPIVENWEKCHEELEGATKTSKTISVKLSPTVKTETKISEVFDSTNDLYIAPDGTTKLLSTANSKTAKVRVGIKHLIWHASGMPNLVSVLFNGDSNIVTTMSLEHLSVDETSSLVNVFVELFGIAEKHGISIINKENPLLWRGIDCNLAKKSSDVFTKELKSFFELDDKTNCYGANYAKLLSSASDLLDTLRADVSRIHK